MAIYTYCLSKRFRFSEEYGTISYKIYQTVSEEFEDFVIWYNQIGVMFHFVLLDGFHGTSKKTTREG